MLFWDTSALVKAYSIEAGTPSVLAAFKATRGRGSILTELVVLEVFTALAKRWRTNNLTKHQYTSAIAELDRDYPGSFDVVEVAEPIRQNAFQLARRYRGASLGAMDLLHLATALDAARVGRPEPLVFATSDGPLQSAAAAEGLPTFNPETDPLSKLLTLLSR
ncbi:MAG: type II toxin-antitoxin system VapC family toxin [Longimicrobiaceae bacterium]